MSELSARLSLPYMQAAQAQKHVTHNEALERLDLLVQLTVQAFDAATPPASPEDGQIWALGAAPSGDWAMHPLELAAWSNGGWLFIAPQPGWRAALGSELRIWSGTSWQGQTPALDNVPGLGIMASHDANNRLVVAAEASLLTHAGGGHQLKINKADVPDTGSLLFQTGFSGRAEMGLAGSDDFSFKVSTDGSAWQTAIAIDAASGDVAFPHSVQVSGAITGNLAGNFTGGAIDDTPIGATTPASGAFTGLTAQSLLGLPADAVAEAVIDAMGQRLVRLFRLGEDGTFAGDLYQSFTDTAGTAGADWGASVARVDDQSPNGRNAVQASAALRPVLGRAPVAGRRNLLNNSENLLGNLIALRGGTLTADEASSAERGYTVYVFSSDGSEDARIEPQNAPSGQHTITFECRSTDVPFLGMDFDGSAGNVTMFDLNALAVTPNQNAENAIIEDMGEGWVRIAVTFTFTTNGRFRIFPLMEDYPGSGSVGKPIPVGEQLVFGRLQYDAGPIATPYQKTRSAFDVTEPGMPSFAFIRFDLSDDVLPAQFPDGFTGDVMVFGRQGSWLERGVTVAAAGSLNIGPDTITGGPAGLLAALGDIVGWVAVGRGLTAPEVNRLMQYHKARGAGDLLEGI